MDGSHLQSRQPTPKGVFAKRKTFTTPNIFDALGLVEQVISSMEQQQKRKLAIMDFTRLNGAVDNFGRCLSERLITSMYLTKKFEVIERRQLNKILSELKLNLSDVIDPENAKKLGKVYGVDAIATGSVTALATSLEVNARLIETETGRIFAVAATRFPKDRDVLALMGEAPLALPPASPPPRRPGGLPPTRRKREVRAVGQMVLIPAGLFSFGPEDHEKDIDLKAFHIDAFEVTNAQYAKVRPRRFPANKANHPVVKVSWFDARRYCKKVGKRLPTEQEWEKAARGTDARRFPWGEVFDPKRLNSAKRRKGATPVGQFQAGKGPYGVHDVAGNVAEWTATETTGSYYRRSRLTTYKAAIIRGGHWDSSDRTFEDGISKVRATWGLKTRKDFIGFRCIKNASL